MQTGPLSSSGKSGISLRNNEDLFAKGTISMHTAALHTVKPLEVRIPKGRLSFGFGKDNNGA